MVEYLEEPACAERALVAPEAGKLASNPAFWGVMISFLVHGLVVSTWVSRIAGIKDSLRLSDGALGFALLGTAIGSIAAIPVCGAMVVRYGSKRVAQWTGLGFCAALVLPALAQGGGSLFAALLVYGAMAGANDVAMNAQAVATEKLLGTLTMSRFHAMFSFGGIFGAVAGGFAAAHGLGPLAHLAGGSILFAAALGVMGRLMVENPDRTPGPKRSRLDKIPAALIALCAIGFCIFLSEGAIADWTAVYMNQVLRSGPGVAPFGYAVFSAAMALFRFSGDAITSRMGRKWTIRTGGLVAAAGLTVVVCSHSPLLALAGFAATGAGFSSIIPLVFAAGGRIPSVAEGAGVATVSGLGYLGFLVGPPLIGMISQMTSLRAGLFVLVVLSTVAAAMVSAVKGEILD
jgi:MFS family permease